MGSVRRPTVGGGSREHGSGLTRRDFVGIATATAGLAPVGLRGLCPGPERADRTSPWADEPRVVVASAPLAAPDRGFEAFSREVERATAAGIGVLFVPVATVEHEAGAMRNLRRFYRYCGRLADRVRAPTAPVTADPGVRSPREAVDRAADDRPWLVPTFQGLQMVVEDVPAVAEYASLGVAVMALTHNWKNWNGDGCLERSDLPLTGLGELVVEAMNEAGVLIDLSRAGRRSSLRALEVSRHPAVFTNSNAAAVHDHPRNLIDEQIDACAAGGGVIGVTAFPAFLAEGRPTLDDLLRHVDHIAGRVGVQHVGLGFGFTERWEGREGSGADPIPRPPYRYPAGLETLADLPALAEALRRAGHDESGVRAVLGGNFLRALSTVRESAAG